jgi:uncharacterized protein YndB with AHSA1/START domain
VARNRRLVAAPPERLFDILADPWRYPHWVVGSRAIRAADPAFPEPGTRFHHSVGIGPLVVRDHTEVLECDPPWRLRLAAHARPVGSATVTLDLEPRGAGTVVTLIEDPRGMSAPLRLVPPVHLFTRVRNAESLRRLAELAERGA